MTGSKPIILFLAFGLLAQCNPKPVEGGLQRYFDLDSLVSSQVENIPLQNATLSKKIVIDRKTESKDINLDSAGWSEEFKLFSLANINKPVNWGMYTVVDKKDEHSNLHIREYRHIEQEEAEVPFLKIWYLGDFTSTKKIHLKYVHDNIVFHSERVLKIEMDEINGETLINRYSINGYQKLIGMDTAYYSMEGEVLFPTTR